MPPAAVHYDTIGTPSHDPGQLPSKGAQSKTTGKKEKRETDVAPNNAPNYDDNDLLESSDDEWTAMVAQWRKRDFRAEAKKHRKETRARRLEEKLEDVRELHRIEMDLLYTLAWGMKKSP
jgi:hypothetical protein